MLTGKTLELLENKILHHLQAIYGDAKTDSELNELTQELIDIMGFQQHYEAVSPHQNYWTEQDVTVITYGHSIQKEDEPPLHTLHGFLNDYLKQSINSVHILPFFPFSADDGFAVCDYYEINPTLGHWQDIENIASEYRLMADLVINHCSDQSQWFKNFIKGEGVGHDYFYTTHKDAPISDVVRPRTSPLLRETITEKGTEYVWCTFSHEQVDLDFSNTQVLKEFVNIVRNYLDHGIRIFRLDAIAFLWKKLGSNCLNLDETHEVVRLIRTLIEHTQPDAIIITETNIPNIENLSYFGNANEAHCVYNFSLPPLLVYTLVSGNCRYLKRWLMSMPPAQHGTTYFNFIASHDGIGLRPAEGLLSDTELATLVTTMQSFGGEISWRAGENGVKKPYEVNITLYDALQGTEDGKDELGLQRFLCAHGIMLALEGIPALYIHSILGTHNDYDKKERTGHNRSINRHEWDYDNLITELSNPETDHAQVYTQITQLINLRKAQKAFHPNATQFTLHISDSIFGFWRQSIDRGQSIFCVYNITDSQQKMLLSDLNLVVTNTWIDLISGIVFDNTHDEIILAPYQMMWIANA
ncbi:alpha-amylase family glycosyl hydrolase [Oceaniserpentilla sp. 4NH20-0058]|uniref:sugar phosphorylase n=1 Tax=Oceaniserpentilla sp. 4NH20-0058 TaxID=3127660 RepID=UPI0031094921